MVLFQPHFLQNVPHDSSHKVTYWHFWDIKFHLKNRLKFFLTCDHMGVKIPNVIPTVLILFFQPNVL